MDAVDLVLPNGEASSKKRKTNKAELKLHSAVELYVRASDCTPNALYMNDDGRSVTEIPPIKSNVQSYRHIAHELSQMLSMLDKEKTTLHFDGRPSIEKSSEREKRKAGVDKRVNALRKELSEPRWVKRAPPRRFYRQIRNIFRPPPIATQEIMAELSIIEWRVCQCEFQADTCIALRCREGPEDDCVVVTRDSDLICYEEISTVVMPVGPQHELTVFSKQVVMDHLELPSPLHLLLAAIVTTNDYSHGIRFNGIKTNCDRVRQIALVQEVGDGVALIEDKISNRVRIIEEGIQKYLSQIKGRQRKVVSDLSMLLRH
ncbi:hypothetical protein BGX26_000541 [Mortierella sp. AD094]|nr:hypothetical protein BGX26_000541 [Mortierella sp. AD094]